MIDTIQVLRHEARDNLAKAAVCTLGVPDLTPDEQMERLMATIEYAMTAVQAIQKAQAVLQERKGANWKDLAEASAVTEAEAILVAEFESEE